jgi:hypothetical protein
MAISMPCGALSLIGLSAAEHLQPLRICSQDDRGNAVDRRFFGQDRTESRLPAASHAEAEGMGHPISRNFLQ